LLRGGHSRLFNDHSQGCYCPQTRSLLRSCEVWPGNRKIAAANGHADAHPCFRATSPPLATRPKQTRCKHQARSRQLTKRLDFANRKVLWHGLSACWGRPRFPIWPSAGDKSGYTVIIGFLLAKSLNYPSLTLQATNAGVSSNICSVCGLDSASPCRTFELNSSSKAPTIKRIRPESGRGARVGPKSAR
jgi:hypothetical protein